MPKRTKDNIPLGSGLVYLAEFEDAMPTREEFFIDANRVGYTKGGATLTYTGTITEVKDDLGFVSKTITEEEEALFKWGLFTWNGDSLAKLIDRCNVTESGGYRITKIGGEGNAQGKNWVVGFHHRDAQDGDIWVMMKGYNSASLSIVFATSEGSTIEPEFKGMPHDGDGTLIEFVEEIGTAA